MKKTTYNDNARHALRDIYKGSESFRTMCTKTKFSWRDVLQVSICPDECVSSDDDGGVSSVITYLLDTTRGPLLLNSISDTGINVHSVKVAGVRYTSLDNTNS